MRPRRDQRLRHLELLPTLACVKAFRKQSCPMRAQHLAPRGLLFANHASGRGHLARSSRHEPVERVDDPLRCASIPQFRTLADLSASRQHLFHLPQNNGPVPSDDRVGTFRNSNRPFSVLAQRQARDTERRRFLLEPAAVREHHRGILPEVEEVHVAERRGQPHGPDRN